MNFLKPFKKLPARVLFTLANSRLTEFHYGGAILFLSNQNLLS